MNLKLRRANLTLFLRATPEHMIMLLIINLSGHQLTQMHAWLHLKTLTGKHSVVESFHSHPCNQYYKRHFEQGIPPPPLSPS